MVRSLLRTLFRSGLVAAIGYLLMPKRRNRLLSLIRRPLFRRDMRRMGRALLRAVTR